MEEQEEDQRNNVLKDTMKGELAKLRVLWAIEHLRCDADDIECLLVDLL